MRNMERELFKDRAANLKMKYKTTDLIRKPGFVYSVICLLAVFDFITIYQPIDTIFTEMQFVVIGLAVLTAFSLELIPTLVAHTLKKVKNRNLKKWLLISLGVMFTVFFLGVGTIRLSSARELYGLGQSLNLGQTAAEEKSLTFAQYAANTFLFMLPLVSSILAFILAYFMMSLEEIRWYRLLRDKLKLQEKKYYLEREREFIAERYRQLIDEKKVFYENLIEQYEPRLLSICENELALFLQNPDATDKILSPKASSIYSGTNVLTFEPALKKESSIQ